MKDIITIDSVHFFRREEFDADHSQHRFVVFNNLKELENIVDSPIYDVYEKSIDRFSLFRILKTCDRDSDGGYVAFANIGNPIDRLALDNSIYYSSKVNRTHSQWEEAKKDFKSTALELMDMKRAFPENLSKKDRIIYLGKIYELREVLNDKAKVIKKTRTCKNKAMHDYDIYKKEVKKC